jgi:hypothetical protein
MDLGGMGVFGCFYFTENLKEGTENLKDFSFFSLYFL